MTQTQELIDTMERASESMEQSHKSLTQKIGVIQRLRIALEEIAEHEDCTPVIERIARAALEE